ncbi:MAG: DUF4339 domain-containing protein [Bacteriovoracaceae bacterium]
MKKVWFILEENYHRGPFTFEELSLMFEHKKLKESDLIWREGLPSGVAFKEIHKLEILKIEESIPAIPQDAKLPVLNELMDAPRHPGKPATLPTPINTGNFSEIPHNHPLKKPLDDEGSANQMELPIIKKTSGTKIFRIYFASLGALILGVALFIYYQYSFKIPKLTEPLTMSGSDYERLSEVVKLRQEKKFLTELAVSKNFDVLWIATNFPYSGKVKLEFSSYPAKTTRNMAVVGTSVGELDHFLMTFQDLQFTSSDRLVQGVYHIKVKLLEEYPASLIQKIVYKERVFPVVEFDTFIGFGNEDQFLKRLKGNEANVEPKTPVEIESEELLKLIEKEERLRTLLTLITMTEDKTSFVITTVKEKKLLSKKQELKKLVEDFEHKYMTEVSPLLSSLGQEANLELSRALGSHFMSTLGYMRKVSNEKKSDSHKFETFGKESLLKFKEMSLNIENELKSLESEIADLKTRTVK